MDSNIISLTDSDGLLLKSDSGEAYYVNQVDASIILRYYFGVIVQDKRPESVDVSSLVLVNESPYVPTLNVIFDDVPGWLVLVEPAKAPTRKKWYVTVVNNGEIGGNWDDFDPNLFPSPEIILHDGRLYKMYLSSYITKVSSVMSFIS